MILAKRATMKIVFFDLVHDPGLKADRLETRVKFFPKEPYLIFPLNTKSLGESKPFRFSTK